MNDTICFDREEILEIGKMINLAGLNGHELGPVLEGVLEKIDAWLDEQEEDD